VIIPSTPGSVGERYLDQVSVEELPPVLDGLLLGLKRDKESILEAALPHEILFIYFYLFVFIYLFIYFFIFFCRHLAVSTSTTKMA
jgi:hypothetical protein